MIKNYNNNNNNNDDSNNNDNTKNIKRGTGRCDVKLRSNVPSTKYSLSCRRFSETQYNI